MTAPTMNDCTRQHVGAPVTCSTVFAAAVSAALLASALPARAEPAPEALGRVIDQAVARVPACVGLAVGATHGNVRVQRFYGDAGNHRHPGPDTEFEIGSITKTMTATLLAFEDRQGTMNLGDPLARYGPPGYRVPAFNGRPILLAHLAEHTSGLPRAVPNPTAGMSPERLWQFISTYQLARAPGDQFLYSNLGIALLARAMVRRSHESEDQLYARIITGPLGLRDTAIAMKPAQRARLAQGFAPNGQPANEVEFVRGFPAMAGAGALRSTLDDMMRYLDFELGRLDVPLRTLLPVLHQPRHAAGPNGSVGLAWQMRDGPNARIIFKDGAMPGFSSYIAFAPSHGTGVVVLSNQSRCAVQKIAGQIMGALNGADVQELPASGDEQ
jgi:D-alanyl-D-alanine-carboxypeptidase/D-alanyl-D-alanine-endopeptidase